MTDKCERTSTPSSRPTTITFDLTHLTPYSRLPMRVAIEIILRSHGLISAFKRPSTPDGFSARFYAASAPDTPLLVERSDLIRVAEITGLSPVSGELVCSPAVTFRIRLDDADNDAETWTPYMIKFPFVGGKILGSDAEQNDVSAYCEKWATALLRRGYHAGRVEAVRV